MPRPRKWICEDCKKLSKPKPTLECFGCRKLKWAGKASKNSPKRKEYIKAYQRKWMRSKIKTDSYKETLRRYRTNPLYRTMVNKSRRTEKYRDYKSNARLKKNYGPYAEMVLLLREIELKLGIRSNKNEELRLERRKHETGFMVNNERIKSKKG